MCFRVAVLVVAGEILQAQSGVPSFRLAEKAPPLVPGMLMSIYGTELGPALGCVGEADPQKREIASPLRPDQGQVDTLIYPKKLCEVQVLVGESPAGLLYVQEAQINFKAPQDAAMEGSTTVRVVYRDRSSAGVTVRLGLEPAKLYLEQPAYVGGPVWLHIEPPSFPRYGDLQYPLGVEPADFGCNEVEVRRNGALLPRIPLRTLPSIRAGLVCGQIAIPGPHKDRLPLHLQYRFDQPGTYEARYTRWSALPGMHDARPLFRAEWTAIEIQPAHSFMPPPPPKDPAEALDDYLPSLLGFDDDDHLRLIAAYLYDANDVVRRYAQSGLAYWPAEDVDRHLAELLHTRGASDVVVEAAFHTPGAVDAILPDLRSASAALLRGAILGVSRLLDAQPPLLDREAKARVEKGLIDAADHVLRNGDPQTRANYASALGSVHDPRARDLLWSFVSRNIEPEQSVIAITWFKNLADLPRLASLLEAPAEGDRMQRTYASLPYALHRAYGDAALPVLEAVLQKSGYVWVQTNAAAELVMAGRKSGFAFMLDAMEQGRFYRAQMVQLMKDHFLELHDADDTQILAFLRAHS